LEKLIENNTEKYFAVLLEPFSASSLLELSTEFLIATRKLCTKYDIVLIYDEVYTGWAKTGSLMNFMRSSEESNGYVSVSPDILTSAKTLGGGKASIAGYIASDKIFKKAYDNLKDATLHSTTYYGLGEESVTALEAINIVVEENHPELARSLGEKIHLRSEKLQNQFPELISDIRGKGLLHGIVLNADIKIIKKLIKLLPKSISSDEQFVDKLVTGSLISYLYDNFGLLTYYGSNQRIVFKIAPSTSISEDDIDYLFDALEQTLELGWIKILSSFVNRKVKSLIPIPN
jgi:putrescine aminotransferase